MPRRPRIHLDGVPLHLVQRGNNRSVCFFAAEDYNSYLHWLGKAETCLLACQRYIELKPVRK